MLAWYVYDDVGSLYIYMPIVRDTEDSINNIHLNIVVDHKKTYCDFRFWKINNNDCVSDRTLIIINVCINMGGFHSILVN